MNQFLAVLLLLPVVASSQVTIPTLLMEGFENTVMSSDQSLDTDGYLIDQKYSNQKYLIKRFLFNELTKAQSFFQESRSEPEFTDWLVRQGFDQKIIFKSGHSDYIDILVVRQKVDEVILVVDHNRDKVFNEEPIVYNNNLDSKVSDLHLLPKIFVDLELYDKRGNKKSVKHSVSLNPHKNGYSFSKANDNEIPFSVLSNNFKSCTIDHMGASYHIKLFNNSISPYYLHSSTEFTVEKEDSTGLFLETRRYNIGDFIWGINLKIVSVSAFGDLLFIEEFDNMLGYGINEDEYVTNDIIKLFNKQNKYLILNFWGTWCKPCLEEFPSLVSVYEQLDLSKVSFVSISTQSTEEKITSIFEKNQIMWSNLRNEDLPRDIVNKMRINTFPTTILIDSQNKIIKKYEEILNEIEFLNILQEANLLKE